MMKLNEPRFNGSETVETTYDHLSRISTKTTTTIKPVGEPNSVGQIIDEFVETITYEYDSLGRILKTTTDRSITRKRIPDTKSDEVKEPEKVNLRKYSDSLEKPSKPKAPVDLFAEISMSYFGNPDGIIIGRHKNEEVFDSVKIGDEVNVLLTKHIHTGSGYSVITEKTVLRCTVTSATKYLIWVRPLLYTVTINTTGWKPTRVWF